MPSIAVDQSGNTAIGYAASSPSLFPGIRYAGRLAGDPPNNLGQGENTMFTGTGSQIGTNGRWGDYSMTTIDPTDGTSFWTVGEYYATNSSFNWRTRIGKFSFQVGGATPTPTPTATPASCSWAAGPSMPSVGTRMVGVFFPANGKFYAMGGRMSDSAGSEFTHPLEYDPVGNSWTTKAATYPDPMVNNMACGVLTDAGTPYIYCAGGSQVTNPAISDRVFRYDPVTDTISRLLLPGLLSREWFCPVASQSSTTSSISWVGSTPSRTEDRDQPDLGVYSVTGGLGTEGRCSACSARLHTHHDHRQPHLHRWGQRYHRLAFLPILQTRLFITRWRILSAR